MRRRVLGEERALSLAGARCVVEIGDFRRYQCAGVMP